MIAFMGVRSSWLMFARKPLLAWFAASAASIACFSSTVRWATVASSSALCRSSSRFFCWISAISSSRERFWIRPRCSATNASVASNAGFGSRFSARRAWKAVPGARPLRPSKNPASPASPGVLAAAFEVEDELRRGELHRQGDRDARLEVVAAQLPCGLGDGGCEAGRLDRVVAECIREAADLVARVVHRRSVLEADLPERDHALYRTAMQAASSWSLPKRWTMLLATSFGAWRKTPG